MMDEKTRNLTTFIYYSIGFSLITVGTLLLVRLFTPYSKETLLSHPIAALALIFCSCLLLSWGATVVWMTMAARGKYEEYLAERQGSWEPALVLAGLTLLFYGITTSIYFQTSTLPTYSVRYFFIKVFHLLPIALGFFIFRYRLIIDHWIKEKRKLNRVPEKTGYEYPITKK